MRLYLKLQASTSEARANCVQQPEKEAPTTSPEGAPFRRVPERLRSPELYQGAYRDSAGQAWQARRANAIKLAMAYTITAHSINGEVREQRETANAALDEAMRLEAQGCRLVRVQDGSGNEFNVTQLHRRLNGMGLGPGT